MSYLEAEKLLDTYTFEELLERNELSEVDVVSLLIDEGILDVIYPADVFRLQRS